ncbi:MAG: outer membrane beta-barrel protein [Deltaproteobacteria bacterium]|nr:outer membrane beta-barrel protein [Deltaproteobacteria bacterium]
MRTAFLAFSTSIAILGGAATASAQSFGSPGVIAPGGNVSFYYLKSSPPEGSSTSSTSVVLMPTVMYFVIDNLAVGGQVILNTSSSDRTSSSAYGLAPAVGYNVPFSDVLSVFPSLMVGFQTGSSEYTFSTGGKMKSSSTKLAAIVDAPVLFHHGNFFIGGGPNLSFDLMAKETPDGGSSVDAHKLMMLGVSSFIGGWF